MNRDVIDKIGEQQVKRKECRGEKEIIHRMQFDTAQRGNDEHEKEKEEERNRRKKTNAARQRSRLQFLGHSHRDLVAGNQVLVIPVQLPAVRGLGFPGRRKRVIRKVNLFEVRDHLQREIAYL